MRSVHTLDSPRAVGSPWGSDGGVIARALQAERAQALLGRDGYLRYLRALHGGRLPIAGGALAGVSTAKKFITTITNVAPSVPASFFVDIPRDFPMAGLLLDLSGTLNIAAGTTNGTPVDENPMTYIRNIIVECTGGPTSIQLKKYKGINAYRLHHLLDSREPGGIQRVTSGAIASTPFRALIPIDFMMPGDNMDPEIMALSILNGREWNAIKLQIDMGDTTNFINGGDRTITFTGNVTCDVFSILATNVRPKGPMLRYIEQLMFTDATAAIATERKYVNPFPVGKWYRHLLFVSRNDTGNLRQPVDDTFGTFKLKVSQTELLRYNNFRELVDVNRRMNNVQDAVNPAGLNPLSSTDNPAVGHLPIDFAERGRLQGLLNSSRFPALGLTIDVFQDIATASARDLDACAGFLQPGIAS
jgi:hypothetical protein